ncbi:MAG: NlpC/P60 family protein [Deltaproteobacteria bacterium]
MKRISREKLSLFNMLVFPLFCILLSTIIFFMEYPVFTDPHSAMRTYIKSARHGNTGYGCDGYYNNDISFEGLEPGDLVLGAYPDCAYGHYSHVGIYLGRGEVMEAFVDLGVNVQPLEHYRQYSEICLLRVNAPAVVKEKAVANVMKYEGSLFYPLAFRPGERIFNCTKIMWKAYLQAGVDLAPGPDLWITPDAFLGSRQISVIRIN